MRFLKCFEKSTHGTFSEFLLKLQQLKGLKLAQKKSQKRPKMSLYNKLMHCIFMNFSVKAETLVKKFEKLFFWDFVGSNPLPQMQTKLNFLRFMGNWSMY